MDIDKHFEIIEKIVTFSEPLQKILNDVWIRTQQLLLNMIE